MTPEQLQAWTQLGVGALALAVLFLGYKRFWRWGRDYDEKAAEAEEWKRLYFQAVGLTFDLAQSFKNHTTFTTEQAKKAEGIVRGAGRDRRVDDDEARS